jgi:hypothetical protein
MTTELGHHPQFRDCESSHPGITHDEWLERERHWPHRFPIDTDTCKCGMTGKEWMQDRP